MAVRLIFLKTDTAKEMVELIEGLRMGGMIEEMLPDSPPVALPDPSRFKNAAANFFGRLNDNQRQLINYLAVNTEGCSDAGLCAALGLNGNQALAGILGAITKHAEAVGSEVSDFLIATKKPKHYRLAPKFLDHLQDGKN